MPELAQGLEIKSDVNGVSVNWNDATSPGVTSLFHSFLKVGEPD